MNVKLQYSYISIVTIKRRGRSMRNFLRITRKMRASASMFLLEVVSIVQDYLVFHEFIEAVSIEFGWHS